MTRRDYDAARSPALAHEQGHGGCWTGLVRQPNRGSGGADYVGDLGRHPVRSVTMVVADDHAFSRVLATHDVTRDRMSNNTRVRKGKIFGDHAPPAVGAESNRSHFR